MTKSINTKKSPLKKVLIIIGIVILTPIVLIILVVVFYFVSKPIFDKFDKDKFVTLDAQMQNVYQSLKTTSNGADDWKYKTVCSPNMSGWMRNGTYNCIVSISTQKTVTTVDEINSLQIKYYPIIDNSQILKQKSELDPQMPSDFGKRFVVSSAEKNYTDIKSGINCNYSILLYQIDGNGRFNADAYGTDMVSGKGSGIISIRCVETARKPWYQLVQDTSVIIPE